MNEIKKDFSEINVNIIQWENIQIYLKENHFLLKNISFTLSIFRSFFFFLFLILPDNSIIYIDWSFIIISSSNLSIRFILDSKSLVFSSVVLLIRARVITYCLEYILSEKFLFRFILILLLFIISIILLIFRSNLIIILLGWDGLGVRSYFLVIYFQNKYSLNSGIITAITNRLGDIGIIFLICLFSIYGSWNFLSYSFTRFEFSSTFLFILFVTIRTKRAQVPFSAWLPAAIAAPTPVSSLVHSSTLVTAGIFLLIRLRNFNLNKNILLWITFIGSISIFIRLITSIFEKDIKKIIALSTLSHLGFITALIGFNNPNTAFFHLVIHAFFKALLFLTIGVIIHSFKDYQRFYIVSSAYKISRLNSFILVISLFRLCGLPFLSGFYSKDIGLESSFLVNSNFALLLFSFLISISSVVYSTRILKIIIFSPNKTLPILWVDSKNNFYYKNIIILTLLSLISGNFIQTKLFKRLNFIFISSFNKAIIPSLLIILFIAAWNFFSKETILSNTQFNFFISIIFIAYFSPSIPSFIVKNLSKEFILTQNKWIDLHTTKTYLFWDKLFLYEKLISSKLWFTFIIPAVIFLWLLYFIL